MIKSYITLKEALEAHRLEDFIAQEEARDLEHASEADFDTVVTAAVKPPRPEDQTSRSPSGGDSTER